MPQKVGDLKPVFFFCCCSFSIFKVDVMKNMKCDQIKWWKAAGRKIAVDCPRLFIVSHWAVFGWISSHVIAGLYKHLLWSDYGIRHWRVPIAAAAAWYASSSAAHRPPTQDPWQLHTSEKNNPPLRTIKITKAGHSALFTDQRLTNCNKIGLTLKKTLKFHLSQKKLVSSLNVACKVKLFCCCSSH